MRSYVCLHSLLVSLKEGCVCLTYFLSPWSSSTVHMACLPIKTFWRANGTEWSLTKPCLVSEVQDEETIFNPYNKLLSHSTGCSKQIRHRSRLNLKTEPVTRERLPFSQILFFSPPLVTVLCVFHLSGLLFH